MWPLVIGAGALWYLTRLRRNPDWITTNGVHRPIYGKGGTGGDGRAGDPTAYDDARLKEPPKTIRRSGSRSSSVTTTERLEFPALSDVDSLDQARATYRRIQAAQSRAVDAETQRAAKHLAHRIEAIIEFHTALQQAQRSTADMTRQSEWPSLRNQPRGRAAATIPLEEKSFMRAFDAANKARRYVEQLPTDGSDLADSKPRSDAWAQWATRQMSALQAQWHNVTKTARVNQERAARGLTARAH